MALVWGLLGPTDRIALGPWWRPRGLWRAVGILGALCGLGVLSPDQDPDPREDSVSVPGHRGWPFVADPDEASSF